MLGNRRNFVPGTTYFFTVALADRRQRLLTDRVDALGNAFRACRESHRFETIAIVVLPEHLHCIWTLPEGDADYPSRWRLIKRAFTRRQLREGPSPARGSAKIWQPRYRDHTIADETDLARHVDYIHYNPVKHGHARNVDQWPHSSFHRYVRRGQRAADWACSQSIIDLDLGE